MTAHPSQALLPRSLRSAIAPDASSILTTRRLTGGVSAETTLVETLREGGRIDRHVVRRRPMSSSRGWLEVQAEFDVLSVLAEAGLPVPRPVLLWDTDTLVTEWVDGTSSLPTDGPTRMAETLARIHAYRGPLLERLPAREDPRPHLDPVLREHGLAATSPWLDALDPSRRPTALLHGDYWPGNLLWRDGRLVAVLDWEDAARGDPLSDLACAQVELEVAAGPEVAVAFTADYLARTGCEPETLGLWIVYVASSALAAMDDWGLPRDVLERRRAATRASLERALSLLRQGHS